MTNVYVDSLSLGPNYLPPVDPLNPNEPNAKNRAANSTPGLSVRSNTGYVLLDNVVTTGVYATTGGNVRAQTVLSTQISQLSGVGNIVLAAKGSGRCVVTQALGAYATSLSTESGALVVANSGAIVGTTISITSQTGPIYLNNFIQVRGQ